AAARVRAARDLRGDARLRRPRRGPPRRPLPRRSAHARALPRMLLPAAPLVDRELRALEPERRQGRDHARVRDLEADARGVRGTGAGRRSARGAEGVRGPAADGAGGLMAAQDVGSIMSRDLLTVEASLPLQEAARRMNERRVGAALVVAGDELLGILTER